jgi:hypothetical protein
MRKYQLKDSVGKEIFEIHPVILGGDPSDFANKIILSREEHIQAVGYWNKVIKQIAAQTRNDGSAQAQGQA